MDAVEEIIKIASRELLIRESHIALECGPSRMSANLSTAQKKCLFGYLKENKTNKLFLHKKNVIYKVVLVTSFEHTCNDSARDDDSGSWCVVLDHQVPYLHHTITTSNAYQTGSQWGPEAVRHVHAVVPLGQYRLFLSHTQLIIWSSFLLNFLWEKIFMPLAW